MIPEVLRISGFLSYAEPVEIDFRSFRVACISGPNGAGKSTILDAITFALFNNARKDDDSLINSRKKTAEVTLEFSYEDQRYKVTRSRTIGKNVKVEFLQLVDNVWHVLTESTTTLTNTSIRNVLGLNYDTFTNASFFLQGKADQFAQQKPNERKRILSSILGLDIWDTYRERAAKKRQQVVNNLAIETSRLEDYRNEIALEPQKMQLLLDMQKNLNAAETVKLSQQKLVESLRSQAALLEERTKTIEDWKTRVDSYQQQIQSMTEQKEALLQEVGSFSNLLDHQEAIISGYTQWQTVQDSLKTLDNQASEYHRLQQLRTEPLLEIEKQRAQMQAQVEQYGAHAKEINVQRNRHAELSKQLAELTNQTQQLENELESRSELETKNMAAKERIATLLAENKQYDSEMNVLREHIKELRSATEPVCPMCRQKLTPNMREQSLQDLSNQGTSIKRDQQANEAEISQLSNTLNQNLKTLQALANQEKKLTELLKSNSSKTEEQRLLDLNLQDWAQKGEKEWHKLQEDLTKNAYAVESQVLLEKVDQEIAALAYDADKHETLQLETARLQPYFDQHQQLDRAKAALAPTQRQLTELENRLAQTQSEYETAQKTYQDYIQKYETDIFGVQDLQLAEKELLNAQEQENISRQKLNYIEQEVKAIENAKIRLVELEHSMTELREKIAQWEQIEKACSKNGVPALLIEQALPELEAQANDILERLSEGSMSVQLITQADYKNKKRDDKKETLDIHIQDSSGTRAYEMFSGGEAFRVNFAIRLALARLLANRSGARLQTLVIDEGFGSQDAQGRQRLVEAINMVRDDFEKILVITHLEELKDAFSTRIEVEKVGYTSTVQVIS